MEKQPKMLDSEEFDEMTEIKAFNKYHKTKLKDWVPVLSTNINAETDVAYPIYVGWYIKTFSKLGRALS